MTKSRNVVAYFGGDLVVDQGGNLVSAPGHRLILDSKIFEYFQMNGYAILSNKEITLASLALTPLNVWAMVGYTHALKHAFSSFQPPAGHDSDRFMIWRLSELGDIVVGKEVSLRYRKHSTNACAALLKEAPVFHEQKSREYTDIMIAESIRNGLDIRRLWFDLLTELPADFRRQYWAGAIPGAKNLIAEKWYDEVNNLFSEPARQFTFRRAVKNLCPPIIWTFARAMKYKR